MYGDSLHFLSKLSPQGLEAEGADLSMDVSHLRLWLSAGHSLPSVKKPPFLGAGSFLYDSHLWRGIPYRKAPLEIQCLSLELLGMSLPSPSGHSSGLCTGLVSSWTLSGKCTPELRMKEGLFLIQQPLTPLISHPVPLPLPFVRCRYPEWSAFFS